MAAMKKKVMQHRLREDFVASVLDVTSWSPPVVMAPAVLASCTFQKMCLSMRMASRNQLVDADAPCHCAYHESDIAKTSGALLCEKNEASGEVMSHG